MTALAKINENVPRNKSKNPEYLRSLADVIDISHLNAAGIHTMREYAKAKTKFLSQLTRKNIDDVLISQKAARICLRSGLAPELSLRLVRAGVHNACQMLTKKLETLIYNEHEKKEIDQAKINIAHDNVRWFLSKKDLWNKNDLLIEVSKIRPQEVKAALRSLDTLCDLIQYKWLKRELTKLGWEDITVENLQIKLASISEKEIESIACELKTDFESDKS